LEVHDGVERDQGDARVGSVQGDAVVAGPEDGVHPCRSVTAAQPDPGARLLQADTVGSRKYRQRVRCSRFPPIVAMFRNWVEAPASNASHTSGTRSITVGSAASSSIVVSPPREACRHGG
jgi:hypothetical protein